MPIDYQLYLAIVFAVLLIIIVVIFIHVYQIKDIILYWSIDLVHALYAYTTMQLERHLAIKGGQCPQSEVDCPFKPYGCSFVGVLLLLFPPPKYAPLLLELYRALVKSYPRPFTVHKEEYPNSSGAILSVPLPDTG